jgi:hypothetical protein
MAINPSSKIISISVDTVGANGSAVGSAITDATYSGYIEAVQVDYNGSAPATTDLNVNESGGLGRTLMTLTDRNTDGTFYPRHFVHGITGVESTTNVTRYYIHQSKIQVAIAGSNALTGAAVVHILITGA